MDVDRIAVRLGARRILGRDVAVGSGLVLHDHRLAGGDAQLLGEVTHQHVGAAAGRERADHMDLVARIIIRPRG